MLNLSNKQSYEDFDPLGEIEAALDLLTGESSKITPTDVLRFLKYTECKELRTLVLVVAAKKGMVIAHRGKGCAIYAVPF
jgi:hypothetical protein